MRSVQKKDTAIRVYFSVFDASDAVVTGLVSGNFTKILHKDGAVSAVAVTVAEIATGVYTATFTPNATGAWYLCVRHATHNPRGWEEAFDVTTDGVLDEIETGYTVKQVLRLMAAVLCGKASGGASNSVFRSLDDSANRVTSVADSSGNRSSVTHSA